MASIRFVKVQVFPGNLGFEFTVNLESQAQDLVFKRQDDIPVFNFGLRQVEFAFPHQGLQFFLCQLPSGFRRPAAENLNEPGGGFDEGSHFLKSFHSYHTHFEASG